jgi:phage terminase large subunit
MTVTTAQITEQPPLTIRIPHPAQLFNRVYIPYLQSNIATQIFFGSASSGKSAFCAQRRVLDTLTQGRNYLCVRNVANTLRDSSFAETVRAMEGLRLRGYFSVQESRMEILCLLNGASMFFRGLDEPSKLQSIVPRKGVITDIDMEEAMEISEEAANQLYLRTRGQSEDATLIKRTTIRFNPTNKRHWIYKRYFEGFFADEDKLRRNDDLLILRTTADDNRFLTDQDRKRIEDLGKISPYYEQVYRFGKWGVVEGAIFTKWRTEDIAGDKALDGLGWRYGQDFGYGPAPAALVETARKGKTLYVRRTVGGHGLTNEMLAERIKPVVGKAPVVCDSAEPKSIAELCSHGIAAVAVRKRRPPVGAKTASAGGSVMFGLQWLQGYEIVVDVRCQELQNELSQYQYRRAPDGTWLSDPVDRDNHYIDALRYAWEDEMVPYALPGAFAA